MTVNQITQLSELLKIHSKSISIPTFENEEEGKEWTSMLDKDYEDYCIAVKTIFRNIELDKNQKLVKQLEKYPLATLNQIGNEQFNERQRINNINRLAMGEQVILLTEGYRYNFMAVRKRDEEGKIIWEEVRDNKGDIMYIEIPKEYKVKKNCHKEGELEYWDKKRLLENSRVVSKQEVMSEDPYNPYNLEVIK